MAVTIDLARLKQEITSDPLALQLRQMYTAGDVQGVVDALNAKKFALMQDDRWGDATEQIKTLGEEDSAAYALLLQVVDPPSRAEQIWGNNAVVTALDVLAAMGE